MFLTGHFLLLAFLAYGKKHRCGIFLFGIWNDAFRLLKSERRLTHIRASCCLFPRQINPLSDSTFPLRFPYDIIMASWSHWLIYFYQDVNSLATTSSHLSRHDFNFTVKYTCTQAGAAEIVFGPQGHYSEPTSPLTIAHCCLTEGRHRGRGEAGETIAMGEALNCCRHNKVLPLWKSVNLRCKVHRLWKVAGRSKQEREVGRTQRLGLICLLISLSP